MFANNDNERPMMFAAECLFAGLAMAGFRAAESDVQVPDRSPEKVADRAWAQARAMMVEFKKRAAHYAGEAQAHVHGVAPETTKEVS